MSIFNKMSSMNMDKMVQREIKNNQAIKTSQIKDANLKVFVAQNKSSNNLERHPLLQNRNMFLGNLFRENNDDTEEKINYDLKGDDGLHEGESSDFEDWWGVERDTGKTSDDHDSDDDEPSGGEMLPVFDY